MSALYLVGFIQSIFFSTLIATKKKLQLSDIVLILYLLLLGGNLIVTYFIATGFYATHTNLAILDIIYWVFLGPLLYLYIDLITKSRKRLLARDLLHLIPATIVFIGFSGFYFQNEINDFFKYDSDSILFKISQYVWYYNSPIYYILIVFKLRSVRKDVSNFYSFTKNVDLKWLNYLAHGFAFFLLFLIGTGLIRMFFSISFPFSSYSYKWLILIIYIFGIGFYGYKQKGIFNELLEDSTDEIDEPTKKLSGPIKIELNRSSNYAKTGLTSEESYALYLRTTDYMKSKKPFLDSELNLSKLAKDLGTTTHKLSQAINENSNSNFFDFVNTYRVEEVKNYLLNSSFDRYKIISVAYDCGFNSKSSFYTIFKKYTSLTPIQYKQKYHNELVA